MGDDNVELQAFTTRKKALDTVPTYFTNATTKLFTNNVLNISYWFRFV